MDNLARTVNFAGVSEKPYLADGQFRRTVNMSSDGAPYAVTRKGRKKYTFDISIPGVLGNGYDAEVTELPDASAELEGKIYKIVPATGEMTAGGIYTYSADTESWVESGIGKMKGIILNLYSSYTYVDGIKIKYGEAYDEGTRTDTYYGSTDLYDFADGIQLICGDAASDFKFAAAYTYTLSEEYRWTEIDERKTSWTLYEEGEEPEASAGNLGEKIRVRKYGSGIVGMQCRRFTIGELTETTDEEKLYFPVTELPENPSDKDVIRWCKGNQMHNGGYYIGIKESIEGQENDIIFPVEYKETAGATDISVIPQSYTEGTVYHYIGGTSDTYHRCDNVSSVYTWVEIPQPYVIKNVTVKEFIEKYDKSFELASITEIADHGGGLSAVVRDTGDRLHLFYNGKFYTIGDSFGGNDVNLLSAGRRLIVGCSGEYLDTGGEEWEYHSTTGRFNFSVQCEEFETSHGRKLVSFASKDYIMLYHRDRAVLESIYNKLNIADEGTFVPTQFQMSSEKKPVKYPYVTRNELDGTGGEYCCKIEEGGWGSGAFEIKWYVLTIYTGEVPGIFYREFKNDEVYIESDGIFADVEVWKNRLWSYQKNVIRGTAAYIFKSDGEGEPEYIDWTRGMGDYNDSVSQPLWQGADITALQPITNAILFFKENSIDYFSGTTISTFTSSAVSCIGVMKKHRKSVAAVNDSVYYLGANGVYRCGGGYPMCISEEIQLKGNECTDSVGGSDGKKYYLSVGTESGYELWVYDITLQCWHHEDGLHVNSFAMVGGKLHAADADSGEIYIFGEGDTEEDTEYEIVTEFDEGTWQKKKYKEIIIRGIAQNCDVYITGDDGSEFAAARLIGTEERIHLMPYTCERLTVRLHGHGRAEIRSIERGFELV